MRKVGIISLYFNNRNYGGLLQAYALTKVISRLGYSVEQLCWQNRGPDRKKRKPLTIRELFIYAQKIYRKISNKILMRIFGKHLAERNKAFKTFENKIPHSEQVYKRETIAESLCDYDIFVTGSDQVFNLAWYQGEYFLNFVPVGKKKLSYAASMPDIQLSEEQRKLVCQHLQDFDAVSVREKESADYLNRFLKNKVEWLLDPTLLLDKQGWDEVCSERIVEKPYVFCYFLGGGRKMRKRAAYFAKKKGLTLVTLPHLCGPCSDDLCFGDLRLYDVSPEQFISLIKHAEYVFTDSFHAAVFSNIYSTKYFVFERSGEKSMSSRITTLLLLMGDEERFCTGDRNGMDYIWSLAGKEVSKPRSTFYEIQEKSIRFLDENLSAD